MVSLFFLKISLKTDKNWHLTTSELRDLSESLLDITLTCIQLRPHCDPKILFIFTRSVPPQELFP